MTKKSFFCTYSFCITQTQHSLLLTSDSSMKVTIHKPYQIQIPLLFHPNFLSSFCFLLTLIINILCSSLTFANSHVFCRTCSMCLLVHDLSTNTACSCSAIFVQITGFHLQICHISFISSPNDGHFGEFHILVKVNRNAIPQNYQVYKK